MAWQQGTSPDLANMLPGPRFQSAEQMSVPQPPQRTSPGPAPPLQLEDQSRAEARRERRRMKQASPLEGRNVRQSGTGESDAGMTSPIRSQPQGTPPPINTASPELAPDMARYGLAVDATDAPSPTARQPRQRLSGPGRQSPEQRSMVTPPASDQGSEPGSPSRRVSRTDLYSSRDSLESLTPGGGVFRANRRGSGFKKNKAGGASGAAGAKPAAAAKAGLGDLHLVGEIVGASGFSCPMLFCRWELLYEPAKSWKVLRGLTKGATHACCAEMEEEEMVVWEHPLDIHMQTQSLQGWPSLLLRVHSRDETTNRDVFVSYALVKLPTSPGLHHLSCHTWFAVESSRAAGRSFFGWYTGLTPRLEDESFITSLRQREDAGAFICTVGAGEVHLRLNILTKNFGQITHQGGESLATALERLNTNIQKSMNLEGRRRSGESLSDGQRLVRGGREERIASARSALESRRRGDQLSPAPSDTDLGRQLSVPERQGRSSFRGFGGPRASASPGRLGSETAAGQDGDGRSETSLSGYQRPRDRYAERLARRERDKTGREGPSTTPSVVGGDAGGGGGGRSSDSGGAAALSRPVSVSGASATRTNSGLTERSASRSGRGGPAAAAGAAAAGRPVDEDDGLETIAADDAAVTRAGADDLAGRAADRAARRGQQRSAF
ncbi:hypothetical protein PLESTB_000159200 [Pleodorina starrii]|uniref:B9 domain-containing protein 2 n=1 Tax=Pleodorina starrii TaxID=330485 RepID=A0A9W6EYA7_9CHLO|nr:hypothetical protein PLESTM_000457700 [Pleodorina starrii]GLC48886.1 hypothetical protein PLESTB_000159200 [Pleodorina starrii]GLC72616.1 hypothetical protein PLESTF_001270700 [Pleodorina starrii]